MRSLLQPYGGALLHVDLTHDDAAEPVSDLWPVARAPPPSPPSPLAPATLLVKGIKHITEQLQLRPVDTSQFLRNPETIHRCRPRGRCSSPLDLDLVSTF